LTAFAAATYLAVEQNSFPLRNTWILDSGADSHVCNDRTRFTIERLANEDDVLIAGKTTYSIEAFGSVIITIRTPSGPKQITLLNVALAPGFFTNTASLDRFTAKGVHWDTQNQRLHHYSKTFCYVERVSKHWALEHSPLPTSTASIASFASSTAPREDIKATADRWHAILGHPEHEAVTHLQKSVEGAVVTAEPSKAVCEACALSKAREIVSRRSTKEEPAAEPLARVAYDLIQMTTAYNEDKWISHFRCYYTGMDFAYTHSRKSQAVDIVTEFLNLAQNRYERAVRYFRTDGETSLGSRFKELTAARGITTERSAPATPAQNGAAERSGGVIVLRARCLRIAAHLPANLWPEIVQAAVYLNNRTPKRQLSWKTPYEALTQSKPNLSHLRVYGCRAYPLNKHIPRSGKLQPRAHIGYLTGYDSLNIYRVWIPSQEKVVRTRDVTFDEELFYNPAELDLGHVLREKVSQAVEILEQPSATALQTSTLVDDDVDELLGLTPTVNTPSATNSTPASTTVPISDDSVASSTLLDQLPTPEHTPEPSMQATQATQSTNSPQDLSADFDTQNILPEGSRRTRVPTRRQNYAVALSNALSSEVGFHTAFAAGIIQGKQAISKSQHRDTLPAEPRSWKQMLKHRFALNFKKAADEEIQGLEKRETFKWISKEPTQSTLLPLLWVFKYKFDTDGYLTKFKARLCVRGDLQSTEQDTYAATLAARTFRALMAIAAAFDLEIQQYDAVNAFVNSKLNEDIYCYSPEGFER
jgi:transposase InsO family protein